MLDTDFLGEDIYPIYQCLECPLNHKCYAIIQPLTALFQLVHIDLEECGYLIRTFYPIFAYLKYSDCGDHLELYEHPWEHGWNTRFFVNVAVVP